MSFIFNFYEILMELIHVRNYDTDSTSVVLAEIELLACKMN
jgi:hypothetical protein